MKKEDIKVNQRVKFLDRAYGNDFFGLIGTITEIRDPDFYVEWDDNATNNYNWWSCKKAELQFDLYIIDDCS